MRFCIKLASSKSVLSRKCLFFEVVEVVDVDKEEVLFVRWWYVPSAVLLSFTRLVNDWIPGSFLVFEDCCSNCLTVLYSWLSTTLEDVFLSWLLCFRSRNSCLTTSRSLECFFSLRSLRYETVVLLFSKMWSSWLSFWLSVERHTKASVLYSPLLICDLENEMRKVEILGLDFI